MQLAANMKCPGLLLLPKSAAPENIVPRGRSVVTLTGDKISDVRVEDVVRTLRNAGHVDYQSAGARRAAHS